MATKLLNTVKRELIGVTVGHGKYRGKTIIIELEAGDVITFRIKGTRKKATISLGYCFQLAQIVQADRDYSEKMKEYNLKKKAGMRVRRPKKANFPFNKTLFKALK